MPQQTATLIAEQLNKLASAPAVQGCAIVEVDSGMVWHSAGRWGRMEQQAEAAVEFWRLQQRLSDHFNHLGALRSSTYFFTAGSVALLPCPGQSQLILVCVTDRTGMDWGAWMAQLKPLHQLLAQQMLPSSFTPLQ